MDHIDQTEESDLHLLQRLSREFDALVKTNDNYLIFVPIAERKSASGKPLVPITINKNKCPKYNMTLPDREIYASVLCVYHDSDEAVTDKVIAGTGEPQHTVTTIYNSKDQAQRVANAKLRKSKRTRKKLTLGPIFGRADIWAESPIIATGYRPEINDEWVAVKVTKKLKVGAAFTTTIECEPPK